MTKTIYYTLGGVLLGGLVTLIACKYAQVNKKNNGYIPSHEICLVTTGALVGGTIGFVVEKVMD